MLPLSDPHDNELVRAAARRHRRVGAGRLPRDRAPAASRRSRRARRAKSSARVRSTKLTLPARSARRRAATSRRHGRAGATTGATSRSPIRATRCPPTTPRVARLARRYWARARRRQARLLRHARLAPRLRRRRSGHVGAARRPTRAGGQRARGAAHVAQRDRRRRRAVHARRRRLRRQPAAASHLVGGAAHAGAQRAAVRRRRAPRADARRARAWWAHGGEVRGAPTRWGTVSVSFRRRGDEAEWRWTPMPVTTALTLPPGTVLASAPSLPLQASEDGRVVFAPQGCGEARVRVTTAATSARNASAPARRASRAGS